MKNTKSFILGFISCLLIVILTLTVFATPIYKTIEVVYDNIKLNIDGKEITPKDATGNVVEPFNYNGTVYLPVRAVGEALGKDVSYDSNTKTVFLKPKADILTTESDTTTIETKTYEGRVESFADTSTHDFKLPYSAKVTMDFEHGFVDNGSAYWTIQFVSKDGVEGQFSSKGNVVNEKLSHAMYLPAGEYTIRVKAATNLSNTNYKVKVTYEKNIGQFEYEPNDTMETATTIESNNSITGNLSSNTDVDWYKFTITSKKEISLKFTHDFVDNNSNYWTIELITPNNGILQKINSPGKSMETTSDKITLIEPGNYYIRIKYATNHSKADYTITAIE